MMRDEDPIARNPKDVDQPADENHRQASESNHSHETDRRRAHLAKALDTVHGMGNRNFGPAPDVAQLASPTWAAGQSPRPAQSPTELLVAVLRFKWTLFFVFVLTSAPLVAFIWTQIVPEYKARAEIRVRPIIPRLVFRTDENGTIPFYDSFVNTQVSIVRSLTVLQRVLDQPEVQQTQWYQNPPKSLLQKLRDNRVPPMERLRDSLSVRPRRRTEIVDVSFTDPSAADAKTIVNAVLSQYTKYVAEKSDASEDQLYRQLTSQYQSLEADIQGREQTCAELCKALGMETPQKLISSKRVHLDEIQAQLSQLQQNITILEWQMKQMDRDDTNDVGPVLAGAKEKQPAYYQDADWRKLDMNVRTLEHQVANSVYAPKHPERLKLTKDLEFAKELRQVREAQLDEQWDERAAQAVEASMISGTAATVASHGYGTATAVVGPGYGQADLPLEFQLARAQREEQLLQEELSEQQAEFKTLFESSQLLQKENNALRNKRELFDAVRRRLEQKNMERNVPGAIEILTPAYAPSEPASDRRVVFTAMALCVGLGMGGGAAFLRASRNQVIYTLKDMPQPVRTPFLGYVPVVRIKNRPGKALWGELTQNQALLVESVRLVRTALLSQLNCKSCTTVLVTSAAAGTGKSSFTKILGRSMAQAGKRVLLIDADFYNRTLSKWFDLADEPGFMDALKNRSVTQRNLFSTEVPGLSVMPVGNRENGSPVCEEISNGAFKTCMGQLSNRYDYDIVLLDSAPLLPVADSTILAGQVDGTIMVERESLSQRTDVADALARLASTGGRLFGTVFVGSNGNAKYGHAYNSHYYRKSGQS